QGACPCDRIPGRFPDRRLRGYGEPGGLLVPNRSVGLRLVCPPPCRPLKSHSIQVIRGGRPMLDRDSSALMRRAWGCALVLLLALPACRAAAPLADRDALKHIVQDQCVIHWQRQRNAWPCTRIYLP